MSAGEDIRPYGSNHEHLEDELRWLDALIRLRARPLDLQNKAAPEARVSRTVYITPAEVECLVDHRDGPDAVDAAAASLRNELLRLRAEIDRRVARSLEANAPLALAQLARLFGLSDLERGAIVICLAPELRRKYDRLYAYLQDDITRKRPSVDLVLELLCDGECARWEARRLFSDGATLLRAALVHKVDDPHSPSGSSGLAQFLKMDPRICEFLLGSSQMDARLAELTQLCRPAGAADPVPVDPTITAGVRNLAERHLAADSGDRRKLVLHLHGPHGVGKRELALHLCQRFSSCLLSIDAEMLLARGAEADNLLRLAFREGLLQQAILFVEHADALLEDSTRRLLKALQVTVSEYGWLVFLSGRAPWNGEQALTGCCFHSAELPIPDVPVRAAVWERCLAGQTSEAAKWAAQLAAQFQLTPGQIHAAVELARIRQLSRSEQRISTVADLADACRGQAQHKLRDLAIKIEPRHEWGDLVLPEETLAHLREICNSARYQYQVLATWGFGKKLSRGKGLSALFTGTSGTGKTMAAEVLARELDFDLYKVDLSGVVNKYIGETEKNLARIFAEAETSNVILFFDEADALFGKRTAVSDAHDRYANLETSYLLQKMEEYEGIVILATNLRENMDEAFARRIRFIVEFPLPDEANRLRIWQTHFPAEAPVSPTVDYSYLARELRLPGGNIKNIALNAAFLAMANGGAVDMQHILHGTRREYQKMGKLWHESPTAPLGAKRGQP